MSRQEALSALKKSGKRVPVALVMASAKVGRAQAERALKVHNRNVRQAIQGFR
jgi:N-acetylmuramic acid 6-phosphate (MurNAc-6-P) etherase